MEIAKGILKKYKKIIIGIALLILPILLEVITCGQLKIEKDTFIRVIIRYGIEFLIILYLICCKYKNKVKIILDFIIKKRYLIITIIFVIGVMLKINFSSINIWGRFLNEPDIGKNIIGVSREIRADEWLVQSPYYLAQTKNENWYSERNAHIMQGNYNPLMNSGPVFNLCTISKPLIWGFLLLGTEFGFSWWWMLRFLLLLIVSFELIRIVSKKDNLLSITGMFVLSLAPGIMWWFSTAIVDAYIWGIAAIILFNFYMENLEINIKKKILLAIGLLISIPGFAFAVYPAYQVPLAFVVAIFMLNDLIKHRKELKRTDYIIMSLTLVGIAGILISFLLSAWTDIQVMMGTVYPGERFEVGGDYSIDRFASIFTNIFLPYSKKIDNPCEISAYIFPIVGLITLIIYYFKNGLSIIKNKKAKSDKFIEIGLMLLLAILSVYVYIGFNKFFAQITFLYFSPSQRAKLVLELVAVLLIFMLLKKFEGKEIVNKKQGIVISCIVVLISYIIIKNSSYKEYFTEIKLEILITMIFTLTYSLIRLNKKAFCYTMCLVAIIGGAAINPIGSGTDILYKTSIAKEIQEIYKEDKDALWIGRYNWNGQYLSLNGINVLNGVNIYPNFKWLEKVDPDKKYSQIYNRYAHIGIILSDKTEFRLLTQDSYEVEVTYQNLKDLNAKYYFTDTKLTEKIKEKFHITEKYKDEEKNQYIYQFN